MATFKYKARGETGKSVSGTLEAASREMVVSHLEEMGYTPVSVSQETAGAKAGGGLFARFEKVKGKDLVMLTRQLHSLIRSGIPILSSLIILEKQSESPLLKRTLADIQEKITGGASFSDALREFPQIFSNLYVNTVLAGETGGILARGTGPAGRAPGGGTGDQESGQIGGQIPDHRAGCNGSGFFHSQHNGYPQIRRYLRTHRV